MKYASLTRRELMIGLAAGLTAPAFAQGDKVIRFILPNATGSGVDAITRAAQAALAKALGHPLVIDNQPGAGGIVGLQALARSPADGTALGMVSNNVVIFPSVFKSLPFDMPGDFTPIAVVGYTPVVLVVNAKVPATNAKELIALLKAKGGEMNFASGGNGTILHLATEMFLDEAGVKARHIPYKGVGPMLTDLIGGQVEFATAPEVGRAARHRRHHPAACAGRARDPDLRRARPAPLHDRRLVRGDRPEGTASGRGAACACCRGGGVQRSGRQGGDGQAGQCHFGGACRQGHAVLPQRNGALRQAREEGRRRAAVMHFGESMSRH